MDLKEHPHNTSGLQKLWFTPTATALSRLSASLTFGLIDSQAD